MPILMQSWSSIAPKRVGRTPWRAHQLCGNHVCVACGCYAGTRSKGLKQPCSRFPEKAGKEALAAIALGKQPNAAAYALYRRLGKGAWVSRYSKGNGLACSKLLGLTSQAQPLPPHSLDGAAASGSIQKQVKDLVSSLCRPVPERSLGDSSLLKAEGDLERRNSAEDTLIPGRSFGDSSLLKAKGDLEQRSSTAGSILSKVMETGVADNFTEVVYHKDLLHKVEGDLLQQVGSVEFYRVQRRCQPYARNYSQQPLIRTEPDGHHLSSAAVVASGSACIAEPGSPDSAQVGPPPPPPFWRALGTERGGVGGPSLSLARLAWTLLCKPTLLRRLLLRVPLPLPWFAKCCAFWQTLAWGRA